MIGRILAIAAILPVVACAASDFASLQSAFQDVQETRIACRQAAKSDERALLCAASERPVLLDIARQARSAVPGAVDPRTRIGLYRLVAAAGWESRLPEGLDLAEDAGAEGAALCAALPAESFGAPRDCALLAATGPFVAHQRAVEALGVIEGQLGGQDEAAARQKLDALSGAYVANTLRALEARRASLDRATVDPAVVAYFERQRLAFICAVHKTATLYHRLGAQTEGDAAGAEARALRAEFGVRDQCR